MKERHRSISELLDSTDPMLVLLDLNMPVMNGLAFLAIYQQHSLAQKCHLVIVLLTTLEYAYDLARIKAVPLPISSRIT